ncbi:hypothetical protein OSTOST_01476, partial [Ostertagia ostertagi]
YIFSLNDGSLKLLYICKRETIFPSFIANGFTQLPYQNNRDVQSRILRLKTALLDAAIAERRRMKSFFICGITSNRNRIRLSSDVWQIMSSENQRTCNRLREGQARLTTVLHSKCCPPTRHVVIGTNEVDSDMAAALNLGQSFAITPRVNNSVMDAALCGVHQFAYQLRWRTHRGPTVLNHHGTLMSSMPFRGESIQIPLSTRDIDAKIANLEHNIQSQRYDNLTSTERRGVRKLLQRKSVLRITVGDKCDTTVYEESTSSAFETVCKRVKKVIMGEGSYGLTNGKTTAWDGTYSAISLQPSEKAQNSTNGDTMSLSLSKIKTRPIIASCGGQADRLS